MLTIDLIIGIILILIGGTVLIYMTYTLIRKQHIKMSPLYISEALATLILGIFYVVCSCIIGTETTGSTIYLSTTTSTTTNGISQAIGITTSATLNDSDYDTIAEKALRDLYNPKNFPNGDSNITFTSENGANTNELLDEFIDYYKRTFANSTIAEGDSIKKLIAINRLGKKILELEQSQKNKLRKDELDDVELSTETELINTQSVIPEGEDCSMYDEVYFKYMMLVVAFIYGIISLFNSTIECKSCALVPQTSSSSSSSSDDKVFISKQNDEGDEEAEPKKHNFRSIVQVLLAWFLPIIYAIIVTLTMKPSEIPAALFDITQYTEAPSDIINIIENPLNVTNDQMNVNQSREIDSVIDKIYDIMQQVQDNAINTSMAENTDKENNQPPYDILESLNILKETIATHTKDIPEDSIENSGETARTFSRTRNLKQKTEEVELENSTNRKCSLEMMPIKLHTLIVFIISYFMAIFYAKVTHTKLTLANKEQEQVKMLGKYILAFASLWLPSMLEVFARTYLMETKTTVATDLTLALGNITRLLANGINVRNVHRVIKQFNNVRPASECV